MTNRKVAGILLMIWAIIFANIETVMFGNNCFPKSIAELICDGISLAVNLYGLYLLLTKKPTS